MEPSPMLQLLNDIIKPVTFARCTGQGVTYVPYTHTYIYTGGLRSTVPLVWGSLRLAPMSTAILDLTCTWILPPSSRTDTRCEATIEELC